MKFIKQTGPDSTAGGTHAWHWADPDSILSLPHGTPNLPGVNPKAPGVVPKTKTKSCASWSLKAVGGGGENKFTCELNVSAAWV